MPERDHEDRMPSGEFLTEAELRRTRAELAAASARAAAVARSSGTVMHPRVAALRALSRATSAGE